MNTTTEDSLVRRQSAPVNQKSRPNQLPKVCLKSNRLSYPRCFAYLQDWLADLKNHLNRMVY